MDFVDALSQNWWFFPAVLTLLSILIIVFWICLKTTIMLPRLDWRPKFSFICSDWTENHQLELSRPEIEYNLSLTSNFRTAREKNELIGDEERTFTIEIQTKNLPAKYTLSGARDCDDMDAGVEMPGQCTTMPMLVDLNLVVVLQNVGISLLMFTFAWDLCNVWILRPAQQCFLKWCWTQTHFRLGASTCSR